MSAHAARVRTTTQLGLFEEIGVEPARLWAAAEPLALSDLRARIEAKVPEVVS